MEKLTLRELEARIDQFVSRIDALNAILPDIKSAEARAALQEQIEVYKQTVESHRTELMKRNSRF